MATVTNPFSQSLYGKFIGSLLQLPPVRYHRCSRAFLNFPQQYQEFVKNSLIPELLKFENLPIMCASDHTKLLFSLSSELKNNTPFILDNNAQLSNQNWEGLPVLATDQGSQNTDKIFLSTTVHQPRLTKQLRSLGFRGKILSPDQFLKTNDFMNIIIDL